MTGSDSGKQTFTVNGRQYDSLEDVPQPYRDSLAALLADTDGDGIPDAFEQGAAVDQTIVHRVESYDVDGTTYASLDDVPEPARSRLRKELTRTGLDPVAHASPTSRIGSPETGALQSSSASPSPIVTRAGWSPRAKLLAALVAVDAIAVAIVAWFLLR